jgi:Transglutaminase-like superfamily/TgpA N-terminal domain
MINQGPSPLPGSAPKPIKAKARPPQAQKSFEPPEESVGIRIVAFLMALLCICVGVAFVNTEIYLGVLYVIFAIGGSYLSYSYRMHKNNWQNKVVIGGIFLVGINCWRELGAGLELGDLSFYTPIVHFIAGTFVVQTFELRTRSDINSSQLIGLILLCIVAPLGKSVLFGACTLLYVTLGAMLLYYDCLSRTARSWIVKPIKQIRLEPTHLVKPKFIHGSPAFAIAVLPLATIVFFFLIPRADGLIDSATTYLRSLGSGNNAMVQMPPLPQDQKLSKWKPHEKKTKQNVLARGTPSKPGAHDNDTRTAGGQTRSKAGSPKPTAQKRSNNDKSDAGEKINSTEKGAPTSKNTATAGTGSGGARKSGQSSNGAKGKALATAPEDLISYDDQMSIQQELNNSNELLIKIKSNRTAYLRMFVFDTFDGFIWTASDSEANTIDKPPRGDIKVGNEPSLELPNNFPAVELIQDYSIEHDLSRNIPVTWVPQALSPNLGKVSVDNYGAIRLQDGDLKKGMQFKVVSSFPVYNLPSMRSEQPLTEGDQEQLRSRMPQFLQLPDNVPNQAGEIADKITKPLPANWYVRAEALAQYLQKYYTYSIPKANSDNPLEDFLISKKSGDCKDFATALAVLTRSVGIPSRVIAGFGPGDFNAMSGAREVRVKHRHVWTEIYIPRYGWVPFDATPQGYLPDKPREKSYDIVALQESMQGSKADAMRAASDQSRPHKRHIVTTMDIIVWFVDALAIGAVGYFVFQAIRNALRKRAEENQRAHPARKYLKRVEAALRKWKIEKEPSDTCTELGARVRGVVADRRRLALPHSTEVPTWVEEFMEHYDAAYFGNKDRIHDLEELANKITSTIGKSSGPGGAAKGTNPDTSSVKRPDKKTKV